MSDPDAIRAEVEAAAAREAEQRAADAKPKPAPPSAPVITDADIDAALSANEYGDADLAVRLFGGKILRDNVEELNYVFDTSHWRLDKNHDYLRALRDVADLFEGRAIRLYKDAKDANEEEAKDLRLKASAHKKRASRLRSTNGVRSMFKFATAGKGSLGISGDEWNRDPTMLPCANGVIDLSTGKLHPGSPEQYFNKASPFVYTGLNADAPIWDATLDKILLGHRELREYFEYFVGVAATGIQTKDFFCALGPLGNNGKSVVFDWLLKALGDFAGTIKVENLIEERNPRTPQAHDSHLIVLRGLRLAVTSEAQAKYRFSLAKIKAITAGGDSLRARDVGIRLQIEFTQTHSLVLHTNNLPQSDGVDSAFFSRLKVLPFKAMFINQADGPEVPGEHIYHAVPRQRLDKILAAESSGILAFVARCARKFLLLGDMPPPPAIVQAETGEYRQDQDEAGMFLGQCCDLIEEVKIQMRDLYNSYRKWSIVERGVPEKSVRSLKSFSGDLRNRKGIEKINSNVVYYKGISIKPEWQVEAKQESLYGSERDARGRAD